MDAPSLGALWQPLKIGAVDVPNRIFVSAHHTNYAEGGRAGARLVDYYVQRARGGVGLIVTEPVSVHPTSAHNVNMIALWTPDRRPDLAALTTAVKDAGAVVICQLLHCGRQQDLATLARGPVAPSPIADPAHLVVPHALHPREIDELVAAFRNATEVAIDAGFDGVEVHCANGYLLQQFLSPWSNVRRDDYGGTAEGRLNFPTAVLDAVRTVLPPHAVLGARIPVGETVAGGLTEHDAIAAAQAIAERCDYVSLSAGQHVSSELVVPPMGTPPVPLAAAARRFRAAIAIPLFASHRVKTLAQAADLVATEAADMVNMARAHIADPDLIAKHTAGARARPCIGCLQGCVGRLNQKLPIGCLVNPSLRVTSLPIPVRQDRSQNVAVVGGGPSGMQAAVTLRQRGHRVTLFEREERLGGRLRLAASLPGRAELLEFIEYLESELEGLDVLVRCGIAFEPGDERGFDDLVLATGARPAAKRPPFTCDVQCLTADDVLAWSTPIAGRILIVDAADRYNQAILFARHFSDRGQRTAIAALGGPVAARLEGANRRVIASDIPFESCTMFSWASVERVKDGTARLKHEGSVVELADISAVVLLDQPVANDGLVDDLRAAGWRRPLHLIGDCFAPRSAMEAVEDGFRVGVEL